MHDLQWNDWESTSFEDMMSYAWYLYIEDKPDDKRIEASRCLRMINLAAGVVGVEKTPISDITIFQIADIKRVFRDEKVSPVGANKALMQMLKFLDILKERKILNLNLIDIAALL